MKICANLAFSSSHKVSGVFLFFLFFSALPLSSFAQKNNCPAINCDCKSLEVEKWQKACSAHEALIKKNCVANQNTPRDYCALHGPAAKPLPLLTKVEDVAVLPKDKMDLSSRTIASIYWSIKSDIKVIDNDLKESRYGRAVDMLDAIELNSKTLFKTQRAVALSTATYGNQAKAEKRWKNYAEDSASLAKYLGKIADKWLSAFKKAELKDKKTAYRLALLKLFRVQGHLSEQSALAYGYASKHTKSARQWLIASQNSNRLLEMSQLIGSESKYLDFFRHQTATRMQRMSYQWQLADDLSRANEALELSRPYAKEPDVIEVWLLDPPEPEESKGFFFRR